MAYATIADVQARITRPLAAQEAVVCGNLLTDAAVIIDAYNSQASDEAKRVVSCRMVIRALGDGDSYGVPVGATQGTVSALGYSQSWTVGSGSSGELYLAKLEKTLLGSGNKIGSYSPVEELVYDQGNDSQAV